MIIYELSLPMLKQKFRIFDVSLYIIVNMLYSVFYIIYLYYFIYYYDKIINCELLFSHLALFKKKKKS